MCIPSIISHQSIPIYTYKRVVCVCLLVCWFVCLLFIGHTTFVHFAPLPLSGRESRSRRGRPRTRGGQACTARARARMPYNFSTKKSLRWCLSKTKPYARACCRIRNCRDFLKKGKRKPTCHFPSSVYSLTSLGVFTFRIVLNRILHKSSLLVPMESFVTSHSHISF